MRLGRPNNQIITCTTCVRIRTTHQHTSVAHIHTLLINRIHRTILGSRKLAVWRASMASVYGCRTFWMHTLITQLMLRVGSHHMKTYTTHLWFTYVRGCGSSPVGLSGTFPETVASKHSPCPPRLLVAALATVRRHIASLAPLLLYTYLDQQTQVHILRLGFSAAHFPVVLVVNVNTLRKTEKSLISTVPGGKAEALAPQRSATDPALFGCLGIFGAPSLKRIGLTIFRTGKEKTFDRWLARVPHEPRRLRRALTGVTHGAPSRRRAE